MNDRILEICDLLMGAAHADKVFLASEEKAVRKLLADLIGGGDLPADVEARIKGFDPKTFVVEHVAGKFATQRPGERRKLLELVAAVHDSDEEIDLAEDEYLGAVAKALGLPDAEVVDLKVGFEIEELRDNLRDVRSAPPMPR